MSQVISKDVPAAIISVCERSITLSAFSNHHFLKGTTGWLLHCVWLSWLIKEDLLAAYAAGTNGCIINFPCFTMQEYDTKQPVSHSKSAFSSLQELIREILYPNLIKQAIMLLFCGDESWLSTLTDRRGAVKHRAFIFSRKDIIISATGNHSAQIVGSI